MAKRIYQRRADTCTIAGCDGPHVGRGWCRMHYERWRDHGDPLYEAESRATPAVDRFWPMMDKDGPMNPILGTPCWVWTGGQKPEGYGQFWDGNSKTSAHRFSLKLGMGMFAPWLEGRECDHHFACPKSCCNPQHLRPATAKQQNENRAGANKNNKSSGIRGVYWSKQKCKWYVKVEHNRTVYWGGYFTDLAEAEQAAIDLRNRLFTHNDADKAVAA